MQIEESMPSGVLIIGCGYTGCAFARVVRDAGVPIWGTTRDPDRFEAIRAAGAEPVQFNAGVDDLPQELRGRVDTVVDMVGPPWEGGEDATSSIITALGEFDLKRFIYISSTSVYGDHQGEWVDETTPCRPSGPAGERRLAVESTVLAAGDTLPSIIVRLPGIYGPGRGLLERLRGGRFRFIGSGERYSNRIHVDDLAKALWAVCLKGKNGQDYLLTDDHPAHLIDVARFAADLLGSPLPPSLSEVEIEKNISPSALAMMTDSKRLRNDRMKRELGVILRYPSYKEGIRSLFDRLAH